MMICIQWGMIALAAGLAGVAGITGIFMVLDKKLQRR